jgi:hypothetical protein
VLDGKRYLAAVVSKMKEVPVYFLLMEKCRIMRTPSLSVCPAFELLKELTGLQENISLEAIEHFSFLYSVSML